MSVEVWSARDHFVSLAMGVVESSSLLLKISILPGSGNPLREKDLEGISTLKERSTVLSETFLFRNFPTFLVFSSLACLIIGYL